MKKRVIAIIMLAVLIMNQVTGCNVSPKKNDKLKVVVTIFPIYDWVRNVVGNDNNDVEVTLLIDNGTDMHSYQPSANDMLEIQSCDLFIYIGGESDEWVDDVLKNKVNKDMEVLNIMDNIADLVKEEEIVEGMEAEEEEKEGEEEIEYDEHVWLSLTIASNVVKEVSENMQKLDDKNADTYKVNEEKYRSKLDKLDNKYKEEVTNADRKVLLFGDRFPFRYLTDDYNLDYYAAFVGCSAETEASFETIIFLAKKVDELNLNSILTIDGSDKKIAESIKSSTTDSNQNILTLDSMQSVSKKDIDNGTSYLGIMEDNLEVLKEVLN